MVNIPLFECDSRSSQTLSQSLVGVSNLTCRPLGQVIDPSIRRRTRTFRLKRVLRTNTWECDDGQADIGPVPCITTRFARIYGLQGTSVPRLLPPVDKRKTAKCNQRCPVWCSRANARYHQTFGTYCEYISHRGVLRCPSKKLKNVRPSR